MKILITGTDGFIGGYLREYFLSAGHDVTGTVYLKPAREGEIFADITDPRSLDNIPSTDFDAVINAAGIVDQSVKSASMTAVNAIGAGNLARWSLGRGCPHFIQLSSIAVYGLRTLGTNRREDNTPRFRGILGIPYMRSKALAEKYIEQSGCAYTMLRLPAVIGRGDSFTSPAIAGGIRSGDFFFTGSGKRMVSLLYAGNLGHCMDLVIRRGAFNDHFNCCDHHVPWRDLIAEYAAALGCPVPVRRKGPFYFLAHATDPAAQMFFTFSLFGSHFPSDKLIEATGFNPSHHWTYAVRESVAGL